MDKAKRVLADASANRLLDEIGVPDFNYYSAGDERAVSEALTAWPLLASIARALREPESGGEQSLRVIVQSPDPTVVRDDSAYPHKEAG
jgi:hypothetical protein